MYIFFKGEFRRNIVNPRTKYSKSKNIQFSIHNCENDLHTFVLGTMLGDAYITKYGRLQIDHASYEYTKWKFDFLLNLNLNVVTNETKISKVTRIHKLTKKKSVSYRFYTKPCFTQWVHAFYTQSLNGKNRKKLPKNIENLLVKPLSLAIWFMDDGGKGGLHGNIISVHNYTNSEIEKLIYCLNKNFFISGTLHSTNTSRQLYIPKKHLSRFKQIISPFMIPTQRYKLL
jgi:hypothetical protein